MRLQAFTDEEIDRLMETDGNGKREFSKTSIYQYAGNSVCVDCFRYLTEAVLDDLDHPDRKREGQQSLEDWL